MIGLVILLLAGGAYAMQNKKPSPPTPQTSNQTMSEAAEFAKAIESGKPTTCTMTKGDDKMEYHLKGKMMAANITTAVEGKTTLTHMINDEKYLYMWQDDQKQGTKMSLAIPSASPSAPTNTSTPKFEDESDYQDFRDQGYTINCKTANLNDSTFTPPSDINFIDPSSIVNTMPAPGADGKIDPKQLEELQKQYGEDALIKY